jgi:putative ABC transport system substrate-binding protein
MIATALAPKRIELLRELLPSMARIAFLAHAADPAAKLFMDQTQVAVDQFGLSIQRVVVQGPEDFEQAFAAMAWEGADVVVVKPIFLQAPTQTRQIIELAAKYYSALCRVKRAALWFGQKRGRPQA